ncbi:MAG: helix-turn-helix domain-containing protein [Chloroflexi bacterium]|nr:helix-turn-helix domain-containing protein [Chloroflexota bacterium]
MQQNVALQPDGEKRLLTLREVARILRVHPNSVRRWADGGLIRSIRIGVRGDRRFMAEDVDSYLESSGSAKR